MDESSRKPPSVPGPLRRLLRERHRLVAVLLLATVALAASGIQTAAAVSLKETLDANWRGAYDIVVTAGSAEGELEGLLPPNSLSGAERLTLDDLQSIGTVAGIEVAAPIGEVVLPSTFGSGFHLTIPAGAAGAGSEPQVYRVTVKYLTDDGLGERLVQERQFDIVIDETERERVESVAEGVGSCYFDDFEVDTKKYPLLCGGWVHEDVVTRDLGGGGWESYGMLGDAAYRFHLRDSPSASGRITLVDPAAERALLGGAGDFLEPLELLDPRPLLRGSVFDQWAAETEGPYAEDFRRLRAEEAAMRFGGRSVEWVEQLRSLYADNGIELEEHVDANSPYVPLLVADVGGAHLQATVSIEHFGPAGFSGEQYGFPYLVPEGLQSGSGVPVGTSSADASGLVNTFVQSPVSVPWPGTPMQETGRTGYVPVQIYFTGTALAGAYDVVSRTGDDTVVRLNASGFRDPIPNFSQSAAGEFALETDGTVAGTESAYSSTDPLPQQQSGQVGVPVGGFSIEAITKLQSELSFVPLGAYQGVSSTLVAGSSPRAIGAVEMLPSVSGLGLVSQQTLAIGSIHSAEAWGQDAPINAVRVRVGDVTDYSDAAKQRIAEVAQSIAALGFTATIVAGSSPTAVTVQVDDYAFGVTDIAEKQEVGPLGEVIQEWSELGAAARADTAVSTANLAILGIALGSTAILLGAVQFASVPRRRAQAAVLRSLGWTRGRIRRWMAAEEVPAIVVVAAAGAAATLLSGSSRLVLTIALLGVLIVALTSLAAVGLGSRLERQKSRTGPVDTRGRRRLKFRGRSVAAFGARQGRIHLLTSTTHFIAIVIVAAASAGIVLVFHEGRVAGGSSLLAQFTAAQAVLPQFALGASAIAAGVILAVLGRRVDLARRAQQWATMRGIGWTSGEVRAAQRVEAATVVLPAVVIATTAAAAVAVWLELNPVLLLVAAAAAGAALAALVVVSVGRKALP